MHFFYLSKNFFIFHDIYLIKGNKYVGLKWYNNNFLHFNHMINKKQMDEQEQKDFDTTEKIMKQIFTSYHATAQLNKNESYAPVDAYMNVKKGEINKWYSIEIKERKQDMDIYDTLPLKVSKYINIMEASKGITPLVIYLLNNEEYYIFDLNNIDLNKVEIKLWNIAKVQYCEKQEYEQKPTFFIPITMAKYNGIIPN